MKSIFKTASTISSDKSTLVPELSTDTVGLTVLHPRGDDDGFALVDIITVHGLAGHPQTTWTNVATEHYWPLQSLPEDIPRSRIMTFGYNTSTSPFNKSTTITSDIAKQLISHLINKRTSEMQRQRPIIFVAHSLGGIVVKEFLHVASNTGHEDLADCVCGILFLGTPHKGSHAASFMDVVGGVVKLFLMSRDNAVVKNLASNSSHLLELDGLLRFKLAKVDIYSFYELLPMKMVKKPIVERHSALLNLPTELEQIGLEADHRRMCKPPDRNHYIYEMIAQRIMRTMAKQIDKAQYSKDLLEMTNKFAAKQMEHIIKLTRELHEGQLGLSASPMAAILQQTSYLYAMPAGGPGQSQAHGFEEILKTLPKNKVKILVDGIRLLMDRGTLLLDLLLETERQTAERRAQIRIDAEREVSQRRIQELEAENARLRKKFNGRRAESDIEWNDMGPSHLPSPSTGFRPMQMSQQCILPGPMAEVLERQKAQAEFLARQRNQASERSSIPWDPEFCNEPTPIAQPLASPPGEGRLDQTGMRPATFIRHPFDDGDVSDSTPPSSSEESGDVAADPLSMPGARESAPTNLPEGYEGQVLSKNLKQVQNMMENFNEILLIGDLVLRSDESASEVSEP